MSFCSRVKQELSKLPPARTCCAVAESYGVLLFCNTFSPNAIRIVTESRDFAQRLPKLFQKAFGLQFCQRLRAVRPVKVDLEVEEGEWFPWAGGCRVLATPGHTPGHISLYLEQEQVLITGDAAVAEGGRLELANPQFCLDLEQAEHSLERLRNTPCTRYICYHGGVLEKGGRSLPVVDSAV